MKGLNVRGVTEFCRAVALKPQLLLPQISVHGAYVYVCASMCTAVCMHASSRLRHIQQHHCSNDGKLFDFDTRRLE